MNGAVYLQPILGDIVQLAATLVLIMAIPLANRLIARIETKFHLQSNATARATIDGLVEDAVAYGKAYAVTAITRVGPIDTGNPIVASAANFLLKHGAEEMEQLNHDPSHAVELVKAALGQQEKSP